MTPDLPQWVTSQTYDRVVILRRLYAEGEVSTDAARKAVGLSNTQFRELLRRLTGQSAWPVEISEEFLLVPIRNAPGRVSRHYAPGERLPQFQDDVLAQRIERDQARLRGERDRWLDVEQQKYGLARRHLSIDEMPV